MTLFELTMALFILTTAVAAILQLVAATATQRRALDQRRIALLEVANQAERVAVAPWEDTAADKLTTWRPSEELAEALPRARCAIEVTEQPGPPAARRIRLALSWTNAAGQEVDPAAVTIWKYRREIEP